MNHVRAPSYADSVIGGFICSNSWLLHGYRCLMQCTLSEIRLQVLYQSCSRCADASRLRGFYSLLPGGHNAATDLSTMSIPHEKHSFGRIGPFRKLRQ